MKKIATVMAAVLAVIFLSVPAAAEPALGFYWNYDNTAQLFNTQLNLEAGKSILENESFYHYTLGNTSDTNPVRKIAGYLGERPVYIERSTDHIERTVGRLTTLRSDQQLADFVDLRIEPGRTLTVNKGVTLTVYGRLIVDGTLNNRGTIIIGSPTAEKQYDEAREIDSWIINNGTFENKGTIEIAHGGIETRGGGVTNNAGTITVHNKEAKLVGLLTTSMQKSNRKVYPTLTNTGTIALLGDGGVAIRNGQGCKFQNDGSIRKDRDATVKGTISGNRPVLLEQ